MNTTPLCPSCGKPLALNAPKGLCAECLLKAGFPTGTQTDGGDSKFVPPSPQELAAHFPQLEILELIGRGGMGAVYKARQKQLDRIVALKILPPGIGEQGGFAERFAREAKALARLNHPGIVTLYEFGEANGLFFFLMEFVDGVNLRQLLQGGRVASREALAIVPQICDALQYAHDQGIVHRDIKPENILMDRRGRVKVADFGLARLMGIETELPGSGGSVATAVTLTEAGKVMGTPQYMAPEQKERPTEVDHRADIYALGVVFYQMLTGELPDRRLEPPSKKVQLDVRLDEIVLRALEREPDLRYQQASVLKTEVESMSGRADRASSSSPSDKVIPARALRGALAIAMAGTSGMLGMLSLSLSPNPPVWLVLSIPLAALLAIIIAVPVRKTVSGSLALIIGGINLAIWLAIAVVFTHVKTPARKSGAATAKESLTPQELKGFSTPDVIQAAIDDPTSAWPWQQIEDRARNGKLTLADTELLMKKMTAFMRTFPGGYREPLNWINTMFNQLQSQHLITEQQATDFLEALIGNPTVRPLPRIRQGDHTLELICDWRSVWVDSLFGLSILNDLRSVTIDDRPVSVDDIQGRGRFLAFVSATAKLPPLSPGKHTLRLEIDTALMPQEDLVGLDGTIPAKEWPSAKRRWIRVAQSEFTVYDKNAEFVKLTRDPALNPSKQLSVKRIIVRSKDNATRALVLFDVNDIPVPISFNVSLSINGKLNGSSNLWNDKPPSHTISRSELTLELNPIDPHVTECDVVLTPDPTAVDRVSTIDQIWGEKIVFSKVPLTRQDIH